MPKFLFVVFTFCIALSHAAVETSEPANPLIINGDFEDGEKGWPLPEGASIEEEDGNHFLRLPYVKPNTYLGTSQSIRLSPGQEAFRFTVRARYRDIKMGAKQWHDGRIILDFRDADGNRVGGASPPYFKRTSTDWKEKVVEFIVPEDAVTLEIIPVLFRVKSGVLELDDLTLKSVPAAPIIARKKEAAEKRSAETKRRAALVKPQVDLPSADQMPPALRVVGNQIQTDDGNVIRLQGVNIPSMEWRGDGENILRSVEVALVEWNANCIRLPVNWRFWSGRGPYQRDGGAGYRQLVEDCANLCAAHQAYLMLDLHHFRAPTQEDVEFWQAASTRLKNHPAVLFDLFNEPHDISWEVWQNGGMTGSGRDKNSEDANSETLKDFESVGMQALINAVRGTGARNIVVMGGLDWGYDLSGVLNGYALDDPSGRGILYSSHVYPWKQNWEEAFLQVAQEYPVIIGEAGVDEKPMPFESKDRELPATWAPDFLGMVQKYQLSWLGWAFHHQASPRLLLELENYEPTPYWGVPVMKALKGEPFEFGKLR